MPNDLSSHRNKITLSVMAGVATSPNFMEDFRLALAQKLNADGRSVTDGTLFPYGDWGRSIVRQLHEIRHDLMLGKERIDRSIGGIRVLESLRIPPDSDALIFVGHSGGGTAALHAALLRQQREEAPPCLVIMIGSPKYKIPASLRDSVLYLYAVGTRSRRKSSDPVCRLGLWGGWTGNPNRLLRWDSGKYAPSAVSGLPILGGHADYFRSRAPFINERGESNLDITMDAVWGWLQDKWR